MLIKNMLKVKNARHEYATIIQFFFSLIVAKLNKNVRIVIVVGKLYEYETTDFSDSTQTQNKNVY